MQHVFVVAPNYVQFRGWCALDNDPPEDPRDKKFLVICGPNFYPGRGIRKKDGDRLVVINPQEIRFDHLEQIRSILYGMAFNSDEMRELL